MREQVAYVEDSVQALAALCDTVLRRHGREVVEMQFATSRIADVAIDLLALCATIARTTRLIEVRGLEKCTNELNMTFAFYSDARHRIRANLRAGTGRNNDEEINSVADQVLAAEVRERHPEIGPLRPALLSLPSRRPAPCRRR
jgi:hypothetical protein